MKNDDWLLLQALYATKNMTKAAQILFITQPALTKRVRNIEKRFGCDIILRSNRGITFTPEGEYLIFQAKQFINLMEDTRQHLINMSAAKDPTIRIGVPNTFAKYFLVELLAEFHQLHPDIPPQIRVDISSKLPNYLQQNTIDCCFLLGDYPHPFHAHLYDTQQCYAISSKPITFDDFHNHSLILYNKNESTQQSIFRWWDANFSSPPRTTTQMADLDTALDLVASGFGFCIAFGSFLKQRQGFSLLPLYNTDGTPFLRNTWFLYSNESLKNTSKKKFIDFVIDKLTPSTQNNLAN